MREVQLSSMEGSSITPPAGPAAVRVLYTLPDGMQVAALLRTALFRELTQALDVRWIFLSPLAADADFLRQFAHPRTEVHPLPGFQPRFFHRQIELLRREMINERMDAETARILRRRMPGTEPVRYYVRNPLARGLRRIPGVEGLLEWLQDTLGWDRDVDRILTALRPDVVVLSSGAVKFADAVVGNWARGRGVPIFGVVPSWDNLLIKGPTVRSDRLAVWNEIMAGQAVGSYGYRPEQVVVTGPPTFDVYARSWPLQPRAQFLASLGFSPERRLVTYTTMPPLNSNFAPQFVYQIAEWIARGELLRPCQLLVRLHPQDNPDLYRACRDLPHVRVEAPGRFRSPANWRQAVCCWDPTEEDVERLHDTLWHSDVVLNIASTITLEALALDRPVVNLAYNPPGSGWPVPIAEYYRLAHYRPVTESGAVRLARSPLDLRDAISEALLHPERRRAERQRLYPRMVTHTDGRCARRLAEAILSYVRTALAQRTGEENVLGQPMPEWSSPHEDLAPC